MEQTHDIYSKFSNIKRNIDNTDLCHIDQIKFILAQEVVRKKEHFIPDVIALLERKSHITLCNLHTLRFLSRIHEVLVKEWKRSSRSNIWFLGTTLAKSSQGIDIFPILDGYSLHPSFRYVMSYISPEDRIAVFS